jgi:radical SAM protein with 4Fe4S-binding SPASM domain
MKNTFDLLEKYKVKYIVNSVFCNINDNIEDIQSMEDLFKTRKYLQNWAIVPAKCSMYLKKPYSEYKPSKNNIIKIREYLMKNIENGKYQFGINLPYIPVNYEDYSQEEKSEIFFKRNPCSANLSSMYILPDGKVTICEELYWHPRFILGDINEQSIMEIWNSKKAKDLFHIKQDSFRKESACSSCSEFAKCRAYKHICWRDTILAYGADNWDYPDQFCPNAPIIKKDIFF